MKRMAQVDANGIVVNIIVASDDWNVEGFVEYTDDNQVYIGGSYLNDRFSPLLASQDVALEEIISVSADSIGADSI
jgi:hypothetical protein